MIQEGTLRSVEVQRWEDEELTPLLLKLAFQNCYNSPGSIVPVWFHFKFREWIDNVYAR